MYLHQILKKYCIGTLIFILSSIFTLACAQADPFKPAKNYTSYRSKISILPFGVGLMSTSTHTENLNISFPYKTMDASGNYTHQVFNGSSNHLFSNQSPMILFGFDFTRPHFTINFSTGVNTTYQGAFYSLGAGANLYLGQWGNSLSEKTKKCIWTLRPSLNISHFSFNSGTLGTISNSNTTIYLLDSKAQPTFTYTTYNSSSSHNHPAGYSKSYTIDANKLIVSYKENLWGIQPKIALCTNPYKTKYSLQIFASYFIPIAQSGGLVLRQYNDEKNKKHLLSGSSANNLNNHAEIIATYNNKTFNNTPFRTNHIFIGVVFGFTF